MKVYLFANHGGLIKLLIELWQSIGVETVVNEYPPLVPNQNLAELGVEWINRDRMEEADVIVSTIPHIELNSIRTEKPIIAYVTDPIHYAARPGFEYWLKKPEQFTVVGAEDCYPPEYVVPYDFMIPYALVNYPKHTGGLNEVLVVNKKADDRLIAVTRGLWGGKGMNVKELLGGLKHRVAHYPDHNVLKEMYQRCDVLFYFSDSPYTIVLFEAMTVGIPIVSINHTYGHWMSSLKRYLGKERLLETPEDIRQTLKFFLDEPQGFTRYPNLPPLEHIQGKWKEVFDYVLRSKRS